LLSWPEEAAGRVIAGSERAAALRHVVAAWMDAGLAPLVFGPAGCGKRTAVWQLVSSRGCGGLGDSGASPALLRLSAATARAEASELLQGLEIEACCGGEACTPHPRLHATRVVVAEGLHLLPSIGGGDGGGDSCIDGINGRIGSSSIGSSGGVCQVLLRLFEGDRAAAAEEGWAPAVRVVGTADLQEGKPPSSCCPDARLMRRFSPLNVVCFAGLDDGGGGGGGGGGDESSCGPPLGLRPTGALVSAEAALRAVSCRAARCLRAAVSRQPQPQPQPSSSGGALQPGGAALVPARCDFAQGLEALRGRRLEADLFHVCRDVFGSVIMAAATRDLEPGAALGAARGGWHQGHVLAAVERALARAAAAVAARAAEEAAAAEDEAAAAAAAVGCAPGPGDGGGGVSRGDSVSSCSDRVAAADVCAW
jgi:hypothetical protein